MPVEITVSDGIIQSIRPLNSPQEHYALPGFVDAHVHIESSMLVPSEFARKAVVHGALATVSDPHEIANVLGKEGVRFMIDNAKKVPFEFCFGAPSCVPATAFETAGASLTAEDIDQLFQTGEVHYLAEMMNWPGVLFDDPAVTAILDVAKKHKKPIDGHAPGLTGEQALKYISKGITTDHECFTYEEALFKLQNGMKVIIREGSAAKNFEALYPLIDQWADRMMFCSDDKHPDDLVKGHINLLVKRALAKRNDPGMLFKVLRMACLNPVEHYGLRLGTLREGDPADFIVIDNPSDFNILQTWYKGRLVAEKGQCLFETTPERVINHFNIGLKKPVDFEIPLATPNVHVIEVLDGQLITNKITGTLETRGDVFCPSVKDDNLKLVEVNRYREAPVAVGFIKNFGLVKGALASSVAHDSHNIIAVGVDDDAICQVVNAVIAEKGGLGATDGQKVAVLGLPVAGLMSTDPCEVVAEKYETLVKIAKEELGSTLGSPFMSLSFMALLVIPSLKLSDKGLFDGLAFEFCPVEASL